MIPSSGSREQGGGDGESGGASKARELLQQLTTSIRVYADAVLNNDRDSLVPSLTLLLMDFKPVGSMLKAYDIDFSDIRTHLASLVAQSRALKDVTFVEPDAWRTLKHDVKHLVKQSRIVGDMLVEAEGVASTW